MSEFTPEAIEAIRALATAANGSETITHPNGNEHKIFAVPHGWSLETRTVFPEAPRAIEKHQSFATLDGFLGYCWRFETKDILITGHPDSRTGIFRAVLDYHTAEQPSYCNHQVSLSASRTIEAERWVGRESDRMSQKEFMRFIEDHISEISEDSAPLLEAIQKVQVIGQRENNSDVDNNGESRRAASSLRLESELPERIHATFPVWDHTDPYKVPIRLFSHINPDERGDPVSFSYELVNFALIEQDLFDGYRERIDSELGTVLI